ncbi:MAG: glutamine ABC transporter substrate-binding protein [Firmicutes bacterium HGW-Firmicutes-16]|nr:MAG: glutamine ABC transporter substrate-binding protein [Firmicutes bacterium HGW-Firmicutes-16]
MKKYLALTLAIVLSLSLLAGCGAKTDDSTATDVAPTASGTVEAQPYDAAVGKTYTIGTDTTFAPFEFEDETGTHTGIDIQLLDAIATEMGFKVEWQVLGFTAAVSSLEAGQVDAVMAGMSITAERQEKYDFSNSYYDSTTGIAVAADSKVASLDDLKGQTVVAKTGTTGATYAESLVADYALNILYVEDSATMYTYVESGQAVACFEDYPIIQYEISRGNVSCKVITQSEESCPYGFAVMKGTNPELIAAFNEGLTRLKDSGEYDTLLASYFGA